MGIQQCANNFLCLLLKPLVSNQLHDSSPVLYNARKMNNREVLTMRYVIFWREVFIEVAVVRMGKYDGKA